MSRSIGEQSRLNVSEISKILKEINKILLRQGFNECKHYVEKYGLQSIKDLHPALPKINRQELRLKLDETVLQLSEEHPGWGSIRLCNELKAQKINISPATVSNILIKHQMGTKYERFLKLKVKYTENMTGLSKEQLMILEEFDIQRRDQELWGSRPGELLVQDTIYVGYFQNCGEVYLQTIIDSYSSYVFGVLHINKKSDYAVFILHNEVIPYFNKIQLPVKAILTDNGHEYCGKEQHHFELYLKLNNIEHRKNQLRQNSNHFIQQFIKIVTAEFFNKIDVSKDFENLEVIQKKFTQWLNYYNQEHPYCDFSGLKKPPALMIKEYPVSR